MLIITLVLIFALCNSMIQAQSINQRLRMDSGASMIKTSLDTISNGEKYCAFEGVIFNVDTSNLYGIEIYLNSHQTFFLSNKNEIHIRCTDGYVYKTPVITDGFLIHEGQTFLASIHVYIDAMNNFIRSPISSISLVTDHFRHKIEIDEKNGKSFQNHLQFMKNINVYEEMKVISTE